MKFNLSWRDGTYLFAGIIIGLIIAYVYLNISIGNILNHIRIEEVIIGFNESKMAEIAFEMINK
jgi:hypothetical protein